MRATSRMGREMGEGNSTIVKGVLIWGSGGTIK